MDDAAAARRPIVIPPGEGRAYPMGRLRAVFKADGEETAGRYSVSEWWLEPRTRGPGGMHAHEEDHLFYVLAGTVSLCLDGAWTDAAQGTYAVIPGGAPHTFENRGDVLAGFMSFNAPGGFEARMPDIAEALSAEDLRL
jgi:quercetin dioxygenase-like cupin family protein